MIVNADARSRRYRPMLRGKTTSPSFRSSSFAMRSSAQRAFTSAMATTSRRRSAGMRGRPVRDAKSLDEPPALAMPAD